MKIISESYPGKKSELTIEAAVEDVVTTSAYSYGGQLEKLKGENEKLREVVARLVETIYGEMQYRSKVDQLEYILGYGYEVED